MCVSIVIHTQGLTGIKLQSARQLNTVVGMNDFVGHVNNLTLHGDQLVSFHRCDTGGTLLQWVERSTCDQ